MVDRRLVATTVLLVWICCTHAQQVYLEGKFTGTDPVSVIRVNGFPVYTQTKSTESLSTWLSPYLQNGQNAVEVYFSPKDADSLARIVFRQAKGDGRRPQSEPVLFRQKFTGRISFSDFVVLKGRKREGVCELVNLGKRQIAALKLPRRLRLSLPLRIKLRIRPTPIHTRLRLIDSSSMRAVSFDCRDSSLKRSSITKGQEWASSLDFDTVYLECEGDKRMSLEELDFGQLPQKFSTVISMKRPRCSWLNGTHVAPLLEQSASRAALEREVAKIHSSFSLGWPGQSYRDLSRFKSKDEAVLRGVSVEDYLRIIERLNSRFAERYAWVCEQLPKDGLHIYPVNDRVVGVEALSGSPVLLKRSTCGKASMSLPLYFANIDGKWAWVR